jgi:acyl-coenzyme A synthetase/AMP-(fatty) acid ligase
MRDLFRVQIFGGALVNFTFPKTWQELANRTDRHGVTCISGSPSQLRRLLGVERPPGMQLCPLRVLTLAGAPITPSEIEAARRLVTPNVYVDYGSNEISMIALLRPEDPVGSRGNVGRIIPGIEVEAVGDKNGPLPPGRVGLLRFRAPWMANSYVDNPADTAKRFRDGWFYPGDRGSIAADRTLTLEGRADDLINFAGVKIAPADVEPQLLKHPNVADAVLVGVPHPGAGEMPVAFVVLRGKITGAELTVDWAQWIDGKEMPRRVVTMQEIPRNPEGKVLRNKLREIYLAADAAAKRS